MNPNPANKDLAETPETNKDDCWFEHQWTPWQERDGIGGEGWDFKIVREEWRECPRCGEYQVRFV